MQTTERYTANKSEDHYVSPIFPRYCTVMLSCQPLDFCAYMFTLYTSLQLRGRTTELSPSDFNRQVTRFTRHTLHIRQFAVAPSSHLWQAVLVKPDAVIASARHAPHRGKTTDRFRVAADLCVEERKYPREDVVCRGIVEAVLHA
jgi:hypothetical protein